MQLPRVTSDVKVRHKRLLCVKDFLVMLLEVEAHNLPAQNKLLRPGPRGGADDRRAERPSGPFSVFSNSRIDDDVYATNRLLRPVIDVAGT